MTDKLRLSAKEFQEKRVEAALEGKLPENALTDREQELLEKKRDEKLQGAWAV